MHEQKLCTHQMQQEQSIIQAHFHMQTDVEQLSCHVQLKGLFLSSKFKLLSKLTQGLTCTSTPAQPFLNTSQALLHKMVFLHTLGLCRVFKGLLDCLVRIYLSPVTQRKKR